MMSTPSLGGPPSNATPPNAPGAATSKYLAAERAARRSDDPGFGALRDTEASFPSPHRTRRGTCLCVFVTALFLFSDPAFLFGARSLAGSRRSPVTVTVNDLSQR